MNQMREKFPAQKRPPGKDSGAGARKALAANEVPRNRSFVDEKTITAQGGRQRKGRANKRVHGEKRPQAHQAVEHVLLKGERGGKGKDGRSRVIWIEGGGRGKVKQAGGGDNRGRGRA